MLLTVSLQLPVKVCHLYAHEDEDRKRLVDRRDLGEVSDMGQQAFDKEMMDSLLD